MIINHTIKSALDRKLATGTPITASDIEQARAYATAYSTDKALALYAKVKRAAAQQQDEE